MSHSVLTATKEEASINTSEGETTEMAHCCHPVHRCGTAQISQTEPLKTKKKFDQNRRNQTTEYEVTGFMFLRWKKKRNMMVVCRRHECLCVIIVAKGFCVLIFVCTQSLIVYTFSVCQSTRTINISLDKKFVLLPLTKGLIVLGFFCPACGLAGSLCLFSALCLIGSSLCSLATHNITVTG